MAPQKSAAPEASPTLPGFEGRLDEQENLHNVVQSLQKQAGPWGVTGGGRASSSFACKKETLPGQRVAASGAKPSTGGGVSVNACWLCVNTNGTILG